MGGGDFLMLLLQKAPLREDETRFFLAEMINGIDACHKLGFIHRDIKVSRNYTRLTLAGQFPSFIFRTSQNS
jgi:serine/threonine protein kinase